MVKKIKILIKRNLIIQYILKISKRGKPMTTNYERIKNMTVEEMAEALDDVDFVYLIIQSKEKIKQWLESESEE